MAIQSHEHQIWTGWLYADEIGPGPNSGAGLPQIESLWSGEGDPWKGLRELDDRQGPVAVGRASKMLESDQFDSFVARESIRFLETLGKQDHPFFLISSFLKPHDPFMPSERFATLFRANEMKLPHSWGKADLNNLPADVQSSIKFHSPTPEVRDEAAAKARTAFYYGNLAQMDDCIGQVVQALKERDLDRDTIICYTSDHGEMLGDLGLWQKFQFYEGSCGVPLMIRVPGGQPAVSRGAVSLVSLSATLTDLCGVRQVAANDGVSFADQVRNPGEATHQQSVFAEYSQFDSGAKYMIREENLKYTFWLHDTPELYDLNRDPEELHNLANSPDYSSQQSRLKRKLFAWYRPPGS